MKTASHRSSPLLAMGSAMAKGWRWLHSLAGVARVLISMHQATLDSQMELEALVETVLVASVQTVMALEMVLEDSVETEATASVEMEPMDLMEIEEMDLEATALVETEAMASVEMVPAVETQVETLVEALPEVLVETDQGALVEAELKDQDREVLGAIKPGLAEEGSSLVMAWSQALALATAIKALRRCPSIRPR